MLTIVQNTFCNWHAWWLPLVDEKFIIDKLVAVSIIFFGLGVTNNAAKPDCILPTGDEGSLYEDRSSGKLIVIKINDTLLSRKQQLCQKCEHRQRHYNSLISALKKNSTCFFFLMDLQPYSHNCFSKILRTFFASRNKWIIVVFLQRTLKEKLPLVLINTLLLHIPLLALTHRWNDRQRNKLILVWLVNLQFCQVKYGNTCGVVYVGRNRYLCNMHIAQRYEYSLIFCAIWF